MSDTAPKELWQAYDNQGRPITGLGLTKPQARTGILHGAAHVWIWRQGESGLEVLLQKRAGNKATWPDCYDISAAGHIDLEEEPLQAAVRETSEELGLQLEPESLQLLFVHRAQLTATQAIIENEFQWVYLWVMASDQPLELQASEVGGSKWLSRLAFEALVEGGGPDKIVPHGPAYFAQLLSWIDRQ